MAALREDTHDAPPGDRTGHPPGAAAEHRLSIARTARYYTLGGADGADVRELWYVLHGYGQLGVYFIRHFREVAGPRRRVVAPEALSRFYLGDDYDRVGASWMTREERLHEIDDYLAYLEALHRRVAEGLDPEAVRIHLLGFSQGAETATRWATLGGLPVHRLILWGGILPGDLDLEAHGDVLRAARLTLVVGSEDAFATPERITHLKARLARHAIPYEYVGFEGGHHMHAGTLHELAGTV